MIKIVPYRASWGADFAEIGAEIRAALGDLALAIHHTGSTSVPGLDAKDVIDIQVTVADLDADFALRLEPLGYLHRSGVFDHCPPGRTLAAEELDKRYFSRRASAPPVHLHIRQAGRFNQRYALLCRDYLRSHPNAAAAYAEIKRQLARYFPDNADAYYDIKDPVFDVLMSGAEDWAAQTNWPLPPTDG